MVRKEVEREEVERINFSQHTDHLRALVNTVMILGGSKMAGDFFMMLEIFTFSRITHICRIKKSVLLLRAGLNWLRKSPEVNFHVNSDNQCSHSVLKVCEESVVLIIWSQFFIQNDVLETGLCPI